MGGRETARSKTEGNYDKQTKTTKRERKKKKKLVKAEKKIKEETKQR